MKDKKGFDTLVECTFYKGEEECPEDVLRMDDYASLFWCGERLYTEAVENREMIKDIELFYKNCGLEATGGSIPFLLKACLFSELCRHSDSEPCYDALFFYEKVLPRYLEMVKMGH